MVGPGVRGPVPVRAGRAEAPRPVARTAGAGRARCWRQRTAEQVRRLGELRDLLQRLDQVPTLAEVGAARADGRAGDRRAAGRGADGAVREPLPARRDRDWLGALRRRSSQAAERAAHRLAELRQLAARCTELADIDYEFLYDRDRHLLAIGYNVGDHRLDASFYDLLASEARLASFVAIAQGKLPQEHWFGLGRLLTTSGGRPALLSWSGSMFEYLMPLLVMPTYDARCSTRRTAPSSTGRSRTAASAACRGASPSRATARPTRSSTTSTTRSACPGSGFKRGLADDVVIAPYASAMGLMVDPEASLRQPAAAGRRGQLGRVRVLRGDRLHARPAAARAGQRHRPVVHGPPPGDGVPVAGVPAARPPDAAAVHADPAFQATDLLLQERVPEDAERLPAPGRGVGRPRHAGRGRRRNYRVFTTPQTPTPEVHLLSNGRYHVAVTAAGGGYSRWRDLAVTRWHEDPTRDCWGTFCYLRDVETGEFWSTAHQPTLKQADALRGDLLAGPRRIPPRATSDDRDARRDRRLAGGRHRAAPGQHHQPRHDAADDRADELRRGRAGAAGGRRGPPGVQQPVRPDAARPRRGRRSSAPAGRGPAASGRRG